MELTIRQRKACELIASRQATSFEEAQRKAGYSSSTARKQAMTSTQREYVCAMMDAAGLSTERLIAKHSALLDAQTMTSDGFLVPDYVTQRESLKLAYQIRGISKPDDSMDIVRQLVQCFETAIVRYVPEEKRQEAWNAVVEEFEQKAKDG